MYRATAYAPYCPPSRRGHGNHGCCSDRGLSEVQHSAELRKAAIAAAVGATIEWYDFFIYGTAPGLIFPKLFFPNEDPLTGTLAAFSTNFIGFVGRPIGAAIFGHYGDHNGRKATLIATLMMMGIATFLVAFFPSYAWIGISGAVMVSFAKRASVATPICSSVSSSLTRRGRTDDASASSEGG